VAVVTKTLIILGQTAVGKSKLAITLAKEINAEIISADSMQVYRGLDIGTAKPTIEERLGIPHHLIDIRNPDEEWTVSDFVAGTRKLTDQITKAGKTPIIVGGTGLYLWTLLEGYSFPVAPADKEIRERLEQLPTPTLYAQLSTIDPEACKKIHANDKKRIVRALEVYELTGKPISQTQKTRTKSHEPRATTLIGLTLPRDQLYQRINQRVDQMIQKGLIYEVKGLLVNGYSKNLLAFQALGYKEAIEHLENSWNKEKMIEELKKRTRNFARRQMTWFKRFKNVQWFNQPVDTNTVLSYIKNI